MADTLTQRLELFERRMRQQGARQWGLIAPGRDASTVRSAIQDLWGTAPGELVDWFSAYDGYSGNGVEGSDLRLTLISRWVPYSLDEALSYVKDGPHWAGYPRDGASWLPLVQGPPGAGQGRKVLMAAWREGDETQVLSSYWGESPELNPNNPVAASLSELVSGWLQALDDGLQWDLEADTWDWASGPPADVRSLRYL
jgi:hypothetical protein